MQSGSCFSFIILNVSAPLGLLPHLGPRSYLIGRSLVFLPLLQVFFLSHLVSSAKMLPPGASITSEASLYATVTDLSSSPAGGREKEMGAAEGPWKVQGWISSWKYPSDRCISLPTLLSLLLFSLLQIPSALVSWREKVMAELEAHPYKPKSRRSHLHLPCESPFWPLNEWGQVWQTWTGRV